LGEWGVGEWATATTLAPDNLGEGDAVVLIASTVPASLHFY
jgi:hypothetical protein